MWLHNTLDKMRKPGIQVAGGTGLDEGCTVTASGEFIYGMNCASEKEHIFPRLEALLLRISRLLLRVFPGYIWQSVGDRFVIALVQPKGKLQFLDHCQGENVHQL